MLLESIGIDLEILEIKRILNRIDYKHDFECEFNPINEKKASLNIMQKLPTCRHMVKKKIYDYAIDYQSTSSCGIEIVVYFKDEQLKAQNRKGMELEIKEFANVIRTEVRLKNKRLNYNKKNCLKLDKTIDNYCNQNVADDIFKLYVEPIFYTEPFYRLDYALLAIQTDRQLTEKEVENNLLGGLKSYLHIFILMTNTREKPQVKLTNNMKMTNHHLLIMKI